MEKQNFKNEEMYQPPPTYQEAQGGIANPLYQQHYPAQQPAGMVVGQQPAPGMMSMHPGQQVVILQAPPPMTAPPPDYMMYAIMVTICCCWPVGIFAILKSSECRTAIARGDREIALLKSRETRNLSHAALFSGLGVLVICFIILGIYFGVLFNNLADE